MIISILLSGILIGCTPPGMNNSHVGQNQTVVKEQNPERLKSIYQKLVSSYGEVYEQEYFDVFPNSFSSFVEIFGNLAKDSNGFKAAPLYDESHLYVQAFFNLKSIDDRVYFKKVINLCIGGQWEADAVSHLQHETENKISQSLVPFCQSLSERSDKEVKSFWQFYFDGPHPPEKLPEELERIKELNERIYSLMLLALKEVQNK